MPTTRRYLAEINERAVRMASQLRAETGKKKGTIGRVVDQSGCGVESLRSWVKQEEIDLGEAAVCPRRRRSESVPDSAYNCPESASSPISATYSGSSYRLRRKASA